MKRILYAVLTIAVVFVLALATDRIVPLKRLAAYLDEHPDPYRAIALGTGLLGWALLLGALAMGLRTSGRPMAEEDARKFMEAGAGRPRQKRRFKGRAAGSEFRMAASFREIKAAFRSGDWRRRPEWRPIILGLMAVPLIGCGTFGFFFVIGSPLVKLLCAGAVLYGAARTAVAFFEA
jgi:hypothetical protein